jgi:ABC-type lipoprotein export system ATPase subunit/GNAT superfamily N-acetyltransferase
MRLTTTVTSPAYTSYRSARVRSLFNVSEDQGSSHTISIDAPLDQKEWQIGLVVGASGTGKTTLGNLLFDGGKLHKGFEWDSTKPIIDEVGEGKDFNSVTAALASVGLGSVPSWLRPYHVLSMGEKFRAEMARVIIEEPEQIVIDEFTSVIDRQIAQVGSSAFSKAWRRTKGKVILLSCHYDIIDWLCPDWIVDTNEWSFQWRCLRRRPEIPIDIYQTSATAAWKFFKPHHYLDLPLPIAATYYIAEYNGLPVAHLAVATTAGLKSARFTRLVVLPEWQGAGVGVKFLEYVAQQWLEGKNRYSKKMTGIIHTSHPGLVYVLNKSPKWVLVSQQVGGGDRGKSMKSLNNSFKQGVSAAGRESKPTGKSGYGGHLRAVAGFRYIGEQK